MITQVPRILILGTPVYKKAIHTLTSVVAYRIGKSCLVLCFRKLEVLSG